MLFFAGVPLEIVRSSYLTRLASEFRSLTFQKETETLNHEPLNP